MIERRNSALQCVVTLKTVSAFFAFSAVKALDLKARHLSRIVSLACNDNPSYVRGMHRTALLACLAILLLAVPGISRARIPRTTVSPMAAAMALRDSGEFARAAELLRAVLVRESANGDAARLLAQTLYWMKDISGAASAYEAAIAMHPDDTTLRLDYARMLVETGWYARARQILPAHGVARDAVTRRNVIRNDAILGRKPSRAASSFRLALEVDPANTDARRQLDEIRAASSPWVLADPQDRLTTSRSTTSRELSRLAGSPIRSCRCPPASRRCTSPQTPSAGMFSWPMRASRTTLPQRGSTKLS